MLRRNYDCIHESGHGDDLRSLLDDPTIATLLQNVVPGGSQYVRTPEGITRASNPTETSHSHRAYITLALCAIQDQCVHGHQCPSHCCKHQIVNATKPSTESCGNHHGNTHPVHNIRDHMHGIDRHRLRRRRARRPRRLRCRSSEHEASL